MYIQMSDLRVPTNVVVRGAVSVPELVRAAECGARVSLAAAPRVCTQPFVEHVVMLDATDSLNSFNRETARRHLAALVVRLQHPARIIQRAWRRAISDPSMRLCRGRLLREMREMREAV
jgi:hypothetical protein